ncbi:MAG: hypothetical protein JNL97_16705, partial [Verrucomicrobiales bacterium]|nr:hypothetical protein [Verrucomicrobiales bacterium]
MLLSADPSLLVSASGSASDAHASADLSAPADYGIAAEHDLLPVSPSTNPLDNLGDSAGPLEPLSAGGDRWTDFSGDSTTTETPGAAPQDAGAADSSLGQPSGSSVDDAASLGTDETVPGDGDAAGAGQESATADADAEVDEVLISSSTTTSSGGFESEDSTADSEPTPPAPEEAASQVSIVVDTLTSAQGPPESSDVAASRTIVLRDGDVLGGSGSPLWDVINESGTVSPGHSPGKLNVGSYTQGAEGTEVIEINGWNATNTPTVYDQILASGNVTLDGTLKIELSGFTPVVGQTIPILKWGGVRVGEFANYLGTT